MKRLIAIAMLAASFNASAAMLVNCSTGTNGFGQMMWIGTYNDMGRYITMYFPMGEYSYCPSMI